jgi:hypothetical protein
MNVIQIFIIVLLVLAFLPTVIVLVKMKRIKAFKAGAVKTTATVVQSEKKMGFKGNTYYLLTLEYKLIDTNQLYTVKRIVYKKHLPGDIIEAMYMQDDPSRFSIEFGKKLHIVIIITIVWFLLIAFFCMWLYNLQLGITKS